MTDVWKEFELSRQWNILMKHALRNAQLAMVDDIRELWLKTAAECEKRFWAHQARIRQRKA